MEPWQIILTAFGTLLVTILILIALFLIFGKARLKILVVGDVRAVLSLCGIRVWFYPDRGFDISRKASERRLKFTKWRKRWKKKRKQKAQAAGKPTLNLLDELQATLYVLKQAYDKGQGKIHLRVRRFHIRVATGDPASTAILWGSISGASAVLLQWINDTFNTLEHREGAIRVYPDYLEKTTEADIRIEATMPLVPFLLYLAELYSDLELKKAAIRRRKRRRMASKAPAKPSAAPAAEPNV